MEKLDKILEKALYYASTSLMFLMALVISAQVFSRYIMSSPLIWSEELGRYTFVWITFIGMAIGVRKGSHVALDILVMKLKGVNKKVLIAFNNLFLLFLSSSLIYSGIKLFELGARQTSPTLKLPMEYVYIVIPISGVIMFYFVVSNTVALFRGREESV